MDYNKVEKNKRNYLGNFGGICLGVALLTITYFTIFGDYKILNQGDTPFVDTTKVSVLEDSVLESDFKFQK